MPDYSHETTAQMQGRLEGLGAPIGAFNQGDFRTNQAQHRAGQRLQIHSSAGDRSLDGGYCSGVCLDWARRTVLSRPNREQGYLNYHSTAITDGGGAGGHTNQELRERGFQSVGRMAQAWHRRNDTNWTAPEDSDRYQVTPANWGNMVRGLDQSFDESRRAVGRDASDKHFANLTLEDSLRCTYSRPGQWMGALLNNGTRVRCATIASFSRAGQTGHAVAIFRRRPSVTENDSFWFLDPNFGVFSYNQESLQSALQYLFWFDADDTPFYNTSASANAQIMSYQILGGPPANQGGRVANAPAVGRAPPAQAAAPAPQGQVTRVSGQPGATNVRSLANRWEQRGRLNL